MGLLDRDRLKIPDRVSVTHVVPAGSNLDDILRGINSTLLKLGDSARTPEILTAINNLNRKVDTFMATQEERLQAIFGALTEINGGINTLSEQLAALKTNNPQIEDEIAAIEGTVADMRAKVPSVPPSEPGE